MLKAEKRSTTGWTELDLIDVSRLDLDLDHVRLGYDEHDRVAGGDDPADRVRRRLEDEAVLRARISVRLSWSSAVTLRSTYSPILLSVSRSALATSLVNS